MGSITLSIPTVGQPNSTEDPKIATDLTTIETLVNGNIDSTNLSSTAAIAQTQLAVSAWSTLTQIGNDTGWGIDVSGYTGPPCRGYMFGVYACIVERSILGFWEGAERCTGGTATTASF